jgi:hypothetical protein
MYATCILNAESSISTEYSFHAADLHWSFECHVPSSIHLRGSLEMDNDYLPSLQEHDMIMAIDRI